MTRIMNLRRGLTMCPVCGMQRGWDIQCCPGCIARQEAQRKNADGLTVAEVAEMEARTDDQSGISDNDDIRYAGMPA